MSIFYYFKSMLELEKQPRVGFLTIVSETRVGMFGIVCVCCVCYLTYVQNTFSYKNVRLCVK